MKYAIKIKPGDSVSLRDYDPEDTSAITEVEADSLLEEYNRELGELQELLYAARQHSVLIVLQGMDTSGKDGTVKHVLAGVNPQGCRIESFKVPTEEELAHDFLWRIHRVAPQRGMMTIFNRSHYEDVIIVRVHDLVPKDVWKRRYKHINNFEQMLSDSNTIILKFFLHISKREQKRRLEAREENTEKAWKLAAGDWQERKLWKDYQEAYEDALSRCSTDDAPWFIIPADRKWFRDLAVAEAIVKTLRPWRREWEDYMQRLAERKIEEVHSFRREDEKTEPADET